MTGRPLSKRAKHRLDIAAGLLRGMGRKIDPGGDDFYVRVQAVLGTLPEARRNWLRELADWVEAYDLHSEARAAAEEFLLRGKAARRRRDNK